MSILERLQSDLKIGLKASRAQEVLVLRYLLAQLHNAEIEKKGEKLTDVETLAVLKKEAKKRREAIELFKKGGRSDLVAREEEELGIMEKYLPAELGREEIARVVERLMAKGEKDFNALIREAMKQLAGQADGRVVSEVIREKISK